ncbi:hypothetical protein GQ457_17G009190 [Hibiscus cannabinus]
MDNRVLIQQPSSFIKSALTMAGKGNNAVFRLIVKKCNKIQNENLSTGLHLMLLNKELCNMHKMLGEQQAVLNEDLKHLRKFLSEIEIKIKIDEQSAPKLAKDFAENHYKEFDENPSIQPDLKGLQFAIDIGLQAAIVVIDSLECSIRMKSATRRLAQLPLTSGKSF